MNTSLSEKMVNKHIGQKLRSIRVFKQMTLKQTGEILGVTFQQIQKYENGTTRINAAKLYLMADYFDVPISYFYDELEFMSFFQFYTERKNEQIARLRKGKEA